MNDDLFIFDNKKFVKCYRFNGDHLLKAIVNVDHIVSIEQIEGKQYDFLIRTVTGIEYCLTNYDNNIYGFFN